MRKTKLCKCISILLLCVVISIVPIKSFGYEEASENKFNVGDLIEFGSYPQSKVTDPHIIYEFNHRDLDWKSYGYYSNQESGDWMQYADSVYQGVKYRAVRFYKYRPNYTSNPCISSNLAKVDNTYQDDRKCLLIMKNEFMFKSLLLTFGAKNYADLQLVQEGNIVPYEKQLDIKGLPITKVGMPKSTSESLTKILEFDILRKNHIDQADIIRKFATLEKQIIQSIKDKKKEFHKPARIKSLSYYK